jgi:hypothetical protein
MSASSIPMMAMFLLLDKFWATSKPKLLGASQHPDKGSRHYRINHLNSINVDIERPDDGNVLIAGRILGNQQAKISWGLPTP